MQSFAAANYTAGTIRTDRHLARRLGRLMDGAGIAPSALTPDLADQLAWTGARRAGSRIHFHNLARRFDAGVDRTYISGIEYDGFAVTVDVLDRLAAALGVDIAEFLAVPQNAQSRPQPLRPVGGSRDNS